MNPNGLRANAETQYLAVASREFPASVGGDGLLQGEFAVHLLEIAGVGSNRILRKMIERNREIGGGSRSAQTHRKQHS